MLCANLGVNYFSFWSNLREISLCPPIILKKKNIINMQHSCYEGDGTEI